MQRAIPSSAGSGPKIVLMRSQPMLSALSAVKPPRSAYVRACRHALSAWPSSPLTLPRIRPRRFQACARL